MGAGSEAGWETAARAAGWVPPEEANDAIWRARHLNGSRCRWCNSDRQPGHQKPHKVGCRFYEGPVTHAFRSGHDGPLSYWIHCACGRSYPETDQDGRKQECPDRSLTWRRPQSRDLTAAAEGDAAPSLPTRPTCRPRETGPTSETATNELEKS